MTKRRINLFGGPLQKASKGTRTARMIRTLSIAGSLGVFVLILILALYRAKLTGDIASVQSDQRELQAAIDKETPRQKDLQSILARLDRIEEASRYDVRYASRSATIREMMGDFPAPPTITRILLADPSSFTLRLRFASEGDMLDFIRLSEKPSFGRSLKEHSIGSFKITSGETTDTRREIDFTGTFL